MKRTLNLMHFAYKKPGLGQIMIISLFKLHNYNLISENTNISKHGGLAIYLHIKYDFNIININNNSQIWEDQFIKITASKNNNISL